MHHVMQCYSIKQLLNGEIERGSAWIIGNAWLLTISIGTSRNIDIIGNGRNKYWRMRQYGISELMSSITQKTGRLLGLREMVFYLMHQ